MKRLATRTKRLIVLAPPLLTLSALALNCSSGAESSSERDARMIGAARAAIAAQGFTPKDAVYSVRSDGSAGWVVQADQSPWCTESGNPSVVVDGTLFVKINNRGEVTELRGPHYRISRRPSRGYIRESSVLST
jgi:hypothetical protein